MHRLIAEWDRDRQGFYRSPAKAGEKALCVMEQVSDSQTEDNSAETELKGLLKTLFSAQRFAVLATQRDGQPYTNLVAFAAAEDLKHLVFVTPRATRKFANLAVDAQVAMMVDNRQNEASDLHDAMAVTAIGRAEEVSGSEKEALVALYLSKHPFLESFARAPSCAVLKISVEKYDVARKFQNVSELRMMS
jgi:nitroimidazol reductase NimA-like FMN-containing flavoprotein (pyridoxamine 5'-phosphate oxidase superfamily)